VAPCGLVDENGNATFVGVGPVQDETALPVRQRFGLG
jgi:hypothetical protein